MLNGGLGHHELVLLRGERRLELLAPWLLGAGP